MNNLKSALNALYLYRNGYLDTLNKDRYNNIVGESLLFRLLFILINTIKELKLFFYKNPKLDIENKIVCIINSKNNYETLKFLDSEDVVFLKLTILGKSIDGVITYRFKNRFFYSSYFIFFLPFLLFKKENKQNVLLLHSTYGLTSLFNKLVKKQRPRKVIFANDHIPSVRSYILACQKLGVETVYIQHASVSRYFPPLEFNLALLDSKYSLKTYKRSKDIDTQIKLIGIPKLDKEILKIRKRKKINKIGIAINQNDDLQKVENLIVILIQNNFKVILRKHPGDSRKVASRFNIEDGNSMSVFDFLNLSDLLVASDSSIHVEANSLHCRSVYFQFHKNPKIYDYYGFVKNKFIDEVEDATELLKFIEGFEYKKFNFNSPEIVYYNEAIKFNFYGESNILAKKYIYEGINC